jgi:hypothetical protein
MSSFAPPANRPFGLDEPKPLRALHLFLGADREFCCPSGRTFVVAYGENLMSAATNDIDHVA